MIHAQLAQEVETSPTLPSFLKRPPFPLDCCSRHVMITAGENKFLFSLTSLLVEAPTRLYRSSACWPGISGATHLSCVCLALKNTDWQYFGFSEGL